MASVDSMMPQNVFSLYPHFPCERRKMLNFGKSCKNLIQKVRKTNLILKSEEVDKIYSPIFPGFFFFPPSLPLIVEVPI